MEKLVNTINNLTINNSKYELNTAITSDAQGNLTSNPDTVTRTSNGNLNQKILMCQTIGAVYVLPPPINLKISAIILVPQKLMMPVKKEILADAKSGNEWTNRTPRRISRTGVDTSIPISTPNHSVMRKYSTLASSYSSGTMIPSGTSDPTTAPPCGLNVSLEVDNIQKSATPDLR